MEEKRNYMEKHAETTDYQNTSLTILETDKSLPYLNRSSYDPLQQSGQLKDRKRTGSLNSIWGQNKSTFETRNSKSKLYEDLTDTKKFLRDYVS